MEEYEITPNGRKTTKTLDKTECQEGELQARAVSSKRKFIAVYRVVTGVLV